MGSVSLLHLPGMVYLRRHRHGRRSCGHHQHICPLKRMLLLQTSCAQSDDYPLLQRSYIWTRVCMFLWPFILVISAIRDIIMIVQLYRGQSNIEWECTNGGQLWGSSAEAGDPSTTTAPSALCGPGWHAIFIVFIVSLLIDLVFQVCFSMSLNYTLIVTHAFRVDLYVLP